MPEYLRTGTFQTPEPEARDSLPEAEPWMPALRRVKLTDPLGSTCPDTLSPEAPPCTLPF